jgi:hypothetical protein
MTYRKPEILALGDASRVIHDSCTKTGSATDASPCPTPHNQAIVTAYDLDE